MKTETAAEVFLHTLGRLDVRYLFGNAGTDAAPLVEAYAQFAKSNRGPIPKPMLAAHETTSVSMAHGYAMVSGELPAVFVHVNVGTANAICSIINASRENVPILLTAGRTPIYEDDRSGSRDVYNHWGQEMFDQASMLREFVKWDYELRGFSQTQLVTERAASIAMSEPRGPVYLTLPREVLAESGPGLAESNVGSARKTLVVGCSPDVNAEGLAEAAKVLVRSQRPLIIVGNSGRDPETVPLLVSLVERFRIPVVSNKSRYLSFPADHELHLGYDPAGLLEEADAILVLDCDVPWIPKLSTPNNNCTVIHAGHDPLFTNIPIRGFQADLVLGGGVTSLLRRLPALMDQERSGLPAPQNWASATREKRIASRAAQLKEAAAMHPIHPAWVSHCIEQVKGDAIVVNEYPLVLDQCAFNEPGTFFSNSSAAGLGWAMGAALGAKLADPERMVIATMGDGSYIFANPVAGHYASYQHELPVLFVIFNNSRWGAVRRATLGMYPDGMASEADENAFVNMDGLPAFEQICIAAGGYGERVENAEELPAALKRAQEVVHLEKRQALLNVICQ